MVITRTYHICEKCNKEFDESKVRGYTKRLAEAHEGMSVIDFDFPNGAVFYSSSSYLIIRDKIEGLTENHEQRYLALHFYRIPGSENRDGKLWDSMDIVCNDKLKKRLENVTKKELEENLPKNSDLMKIIEKEDLIFDFKIQ